MYVEQPSGEIPSSANGVLNFARSETIIPSHSEAVVTAPPIAGPMHMSCGKAQDTRGCPNAGLARALLGHRDFTKDVIGAPRAGTATQQRTVYNTKNGLWKLDESVEDLVRDVSGSLPERTRQSDAVH